MTGANDAIILEEVTKAFGEAVAVDRVSLSVAEGEFLAILGPSGCGKTTTLRMIAGFELPTRGQVTIHGRDVTNVPAHRRNIGMVFQNYALFPHLDVFENTAFGLRERSVPKQEIAERVAYALELVRLPGFEKRRPSQLSGGEQQRVALARALVVEPTVMLMDEPLGALDRKLREEMQLELKELVRRLNLTSVFVTHDQDEALAMADRVAVMHFGRIEQVDTPEAIYETPRTLFCASFLGLSNVFEGTLALDTSGLATLTTPSGLRLACPTPQSPADQGLLMIRPEKVVLLEEDINAENGLRCEVVSLKYLGATIEYHLKTPSGEHIVARQQMSGKSTAVYESGQPITAYLPVASLRWLEA
jgi:spermidine/putrescine ABC transporter ATP-binding subunit